MSIECRIIKDDEVVGVLPLSEQEKQDILNMGYDETLLNTIVNSFLAITDNIQEVVDMDYIKGYLTKENVVRIDLDLSNQFDEFTIYHNAEKGKYYNTDNWDKAKYYTLLEVVTEEVAEQNDNDFLDDEEVTRYDLYDEDLSTYVPLELHAFAQRPM